MNNDASNIEESRHRRAGGLNDSRASDAPSYEHHLQHPNDSNPKIAPKASTEYQNTAQREDRPSFEGVKMKYAEHESVEAESERNPKPPKHLY